MTKSPRSATELSKIRGWQADRRPGPADEALGSEWNPLPANVGVPLHLAIAYGGLGRWVEAEAALRRCDFDRSAHPGRAAAEIFAQACLYLGRGQRRCRRAPEAPGSPGDRGDRRRGGDASRTTAGRATRRLAPFSAAVVAPGSRRSSPGAAPDGSRGTPRAPRSRGAPGCRRHAPSRV